MIRVRTNAAPVVTEDFHDTPHGLKEAAKSAVGHMTADPDMPYRTLVTVMRVPNFHDRDVESVDVFQTPRGKLTVGKTDRGEDIRTALCEALETVQTHPPRLD